MVAILTWWGISAFVLITLGAALGYLTTRQLLGLLIDSRGRYSLTHLQLALWTIVILSLIAGVFFGRWQHNAPPLGFSVPSVVLELLGISTGSAVTVTAAKSAKNSARPKNVAAAAPGPWRPSLLQVLLEEGTYADQVVDITKFQNFVITVVLVLAYIGLAVQTITTAVSRPAWPRYPVSAATFIVLLGISHAAYLAGKLPSPDGQPTGLTVASRDEIAQAAAHSAASATGQLTGPRPGQLWQYDKKISVWSDSMPLTWASAGRPLVITAARPFVLHWTADEWAGQPGDDTADAIGGGLYAVILQSAELAGARSVEFTRRYLDRPQKAAANGGWENPPGRNHVVRLKC